MHMESLSIHPLEILDQRLEDDGVLYFEIRWKTSWLSLQDTVKFYGKHLINQFHQKHGFNVHKCSNGRGGADDKKVSVDIHRPSDIQDGKLSSTSSGRSSSKNIVGLKQQLSTDQEDSQEQGSHDKPNDQHKNPIISHGNPIISHGNPIISDGNPIISHGNPTVSHGNPTVSHGNPIISHRNPTVSHGNPIISHGNPTVSHGNHIISDGNPIISDGNPTVSHGNPTVSHGNPIISHGNPTVSHGNPTVSHVNPIISHGNPITSHGNPTVSHGNPITSHGNPTVSHDKAREQHKAMIQQRIPKLISDDEYSTYHNKVVITNSSTSLCDNLTSSMSKEVQILIEGKKIEIQNEAYMKNEMSPQDTNTNLAQSMKYTDKISTLPSPLPATNASFVNWLLADDSPVTPTIQSNTKKQLHRTASDNSLLKPDSRNVIVTNQQSTLLSVHHRSLSQDSQLPTNSMSKNLNSSQILFHKRDLSKNESSLIQTQQQQAFSNSFMPNASAKLTAERDVQINQVANQKSQLLVPKNQQQPLKNQSSIQPHSQLNQHLKQHQHSLLNTHPLINQPSISHHLIKQKTLIHQPSIEGKQYIVNQPLVKQQHPLMNKPSIKQQHSQPNQHSIKRNPLINQQYPLINQPTNVMRFPTKQDISQGTNKNLWNRLPVSKQLDILESLKQNTGDFKIVASPTFANISFIQAVSSPIDSTPQTKACNAPQNIDSTPQTKACNAPQTKAYNSPQTKAFNAPQNKDCNAPQTKAYNAQQNKDCNASQNLKFTSQVAAKDIVKDRKVANIKLTSTQAKTTLSQAANLLTAVNVNSFLGSQQPKSNVPATTTFFTTLAPVTTTITPTVSSSSRKVLSPTSTTHKVLSPTSMVIGNSCYCDKCHKSFAHKRSFMFHQKNCHIIMKAAIIKKETSSNTIVTTSSLSITSDHPSVRDPMQKNHDSMQNNRDSMQNNRDPMQNNRDPVQNNHDSMQKNRDSMQKNHDPMQKNRDPVQNNHDSMQKNRDSMQKNYDSMQNLSADEFNQNVIKETKDKTRAEKLHTSVITTLALHTLTSPVAVVTTITPLTTPFTTVSGVRTPITPLTVCTPNIDFSITSPMHPLTDFEQLLMSDFTSDFNDDHFTEDVVTESIKQLTEALVKDHHEVDDISSLNLTGNMGITYDNKSLDTKTPDKCEMSYKVSDTISSISLSAILPKVPSMKGGDKQNKNKIKVSKKSPKNEKASVTDSIDKPTTNQKKPIKPSIELKQPSTKEKKPIKPSIELKQPSTNQKKPIKPSIELKQPSTNQKKPINPSNELKQPSTNQKKPIKSSIELKQPSTNQKKPASPMQNLAGNLFNKGDDHQNNSTSENDRISLAGRSEDGEQQSKVPVDTSKGVQHDKPLIHRQEIEVTSKTSFQLNQQNDHEVEKDKNIKLKNILYDKKYLTSLYHKSPSASLASIPYAESVSEESVAYGLPEETNYIPGTTQSATSTNYSRLPEMTENIENKIDRMFSVSNHNNESYYLLTVASQPNLVTNSTITSKDPSLACTTKLKDTFLQHALPDYLISGSIVSTTSRTTIMSSFHSTVPPVITSSTLQSAVVPISSNLKPVLTSTSSNIQPILTPSSSSLQQVSTSTLSSIQPILTPSSSNLQPLLTTTSSSLQQVSTSTSSNIQPIFTPSSSNLQPLLTMASSSLQPVSTSASGKSQPVLSSTSSILQPLLTPTSSNNIQPLFTSTSSNLQPLLTSTASNLKPVLTSSSDNFQRLSTSTSSALQVKWLPNVSNSSSNESCKDRTVKQSEDVKGIAIDFFGNKRKKKKHATDKRLTPQPISISIPSSQIQFNCFSPASTEVANVNKQKRSRTASKDRELASLFDSRSPPLILPKRKRYNEVTQIGVKLKTTSFTAKSAENLQKNASKGKPHAKVKKEFITSPPSSQKYMEQYLSQASQHPIPSSYKWFEAPFPRTNIDIHNKLRNKAKSKSRCNYQKDSKFNSICETSLSEITSPETEVTSSEITTAVTINNSSVCKSTVVSTTSTVPIKLASSPSTLAGVTETLPVSSEANIDYEECKRLLSKLYKTSQPNIPSTSDLVESNLPSPVISVTSPILSPAVSYDNRMLFISSTEVTKSHELTNEIRKVNTNTSTAVSELRVTTDNTTTSRNGLKEFIVGYGSTGITTRRKCSDGQSLTRHGRLYKHMDVNLNLKRKLKVNKEKSNSNFHFTKSRCKMKFATTKMKQQKKTIYSIDNPNKPFALTVNGFTFDRRYYSVPTTRRAKHFEATLPLSPQAVNTEQVELSNVTHKEPMEVNLNIPALSSSLNIPALSSSFHLRRIASKRGLNFILNEW